MSQSDIQQTNQLMSNAIEMQQTALEIGQEALDQAVDIPLKQSIEFQKSAGKLFLNGLEMGNWLGNRGTDLTREALDTYFRTVDSAAQNATEMTEQGIEQATQMTERGLQQAGELGQQQLRAGQQFQPGNAVGPQQGSSFQQPTREQSAYGQGSQQFAGSQQQMAQTPPSQMQQPHAGETASGPIQTGRVQQPAEQQGQQPEGRQPVTQPPGGQMQQPVGQQVQQPPRQQMQQPPVQQRTRPAPVRERSQTAGDRRGQPQGRQLAVAGGVPEEESASTEAPVDNT